MKLAFLANPSLGHTNFLISLAIQAQKSGVNVLFLLPGIKNGLLKKVIDNPIYRINEKLKTNNIPTRIIPISPHQCLLTELLEHQRGLAEILFALKVFSAGAKHYTQYLLKEFEKNRPDAIVYDYTFFPAIAVSEKLNIPRIAIYHSGLPFPEYPIPLAGTGFKYGEIDAKDFAGYCDYTAKLDNEIKAKYEKVIGQKIGTDLLMTPNSDLLNIITTVKEAEYPRKTLPETVVFTGPSMIGRLSDNDRPFFDKQNKRLIYISLGTVFNKQPDLFVRIIEGINLPDTEILVAAGASYHKLLKYNFNDNVHLEKYVPQLNVLKYTDVFITHGGKNSINEALKFGVPMIVFPAGGEQEYNASLVEYLNAGINFSQIKDSFSSNRLNSALSFLMDDLSIKSSLKNIAAKHPKEDGAEKAFSLITQLVHQGAQVG